ncbi:hypothetical protein N7481_011189 [Penicillium waksmanii]|uniref:uncharacterized protein n=1 Tax=Penicillium waksmanii TaxID=69791 RepID=UPI0025481E9F|nr:uncharacterized protein N7481_011189 [Penicillium waksmanii]KAJ5973979.1 hypothetical protein N7481_011189 [Penicillium waksmanii]
MHRTPLAWPPLHSNLAWLKALVPMADYRILWLIAILLVFTAASILLVFRARRRPRISKPLITNTVATSRSDLQEAYPLSIESPTVPDKQTTGQIDQGQRKSVEPDSKRYSKFAMGVFLFLPCTLLVLIHFRLVTAIQDHYRSLENPLLQSKGSSGLQEVFQVYQPVSLSPKDAGGEAGSCDLEVLLMDHVFGSSYGKPFVGNYTPPDCDFDTVRINFTVTSRGKQYDRLALMYIGDVEVFRTSTAEPTTAGIVWTYIKEMSQYNTLWKQPQTLIFDLGNIMNDVYTGSFNATLTAHFSLQNNENNARAADLILPISARKSASNSASAFSVPADNTTVNHKIPSSASRAVVSISACGQSEEEFWWSNVFSDDTTSFENTVGKLYGYSPFREVQLYIDGVLAGVVWPFPIIFTGGVAPGFWRPIVGADAFDLRQSEIDISPFLPLLRDDQGHSFEIRVSGLNVLSNGTAVLSDIVGSYWVVTGNIFLYMDGADESSSPNRASESEEVEIEAVQITAPDPIFTITRILTKNETGANDTLEYSVLAERTFTTRSSKFSWSQKLTFSNNGFFNQQGRSQVNKQLTSGKSTITDLQNEQSNKTTFRYPVLVNTTYANTDDSITIDAWMKRGLEIDSSGSAALSTYTLASGSGPYHLYTSQSGKARYKSTSTGSSSLGNTADEYQSTANGESYSRSVRAVNGEVVYDTHPVNKASSVPFQSLGSSSFGRDSVRSILGRGPGEIRN